MYLKISLLFLTFVCRFLLIAQNTQIIVDSPEYEVRKINHTLNEVEVISNTSNINYYDTLRVFDFDKETNVMQKRRGNCDCYITPDSSYTLALMPSDDQSFGPLSIPFDFCFYGQSYNELYINNNGNITFDTYLQSYSSNAFPSIDLKIIAPFWGDVDTRGIGQVVYKVTPTALYINWENVGYFLSESDKTNSFQLIITDGTDPVVPNGNIAFCYKDMQWTTGAASLGENGFGGIPATAGSNKGDGLGYFMLSQFDHPGVDFDGALGNPDGISWLDNKSFYFNICNNDNIAPIADGIASCDTIRLCSLNDTANIQIKFLSPETDQITSIAYSSSNDQLVHEISNETGNTATILLQSIAQASLAGYHSVTITATDNYNPPGVTTINFTLFVDTNLVSTINPQINILSQCDSIELSVLNGPYDTYLWNNLSVDSINHVDSSGVYDVTVSKNGCYKMIETNVIFNGLHLNLNGSLFYCPSDTASFISIIDSINYESINWNIGIPSKDTVYSNFLSAGTYHVTAEDINGCVIDSLISVSTQPQIQINDYDNVCGLQLNMIDNIFVPFGSWYQLSGNGSTTFGTINSINTSIEVSSYGAYEFVFSELTCQDADTLSIVFNEQPQISLSSGGIFCEETPVVLSASTSNNTIAIFSWDTGVVGNSLEILQNGIYSVTASNECGSDEASTSVEFVVCNLIFPNVFTPSGDNVNEVFKGIIEADGFKDFKCQIFNRWGNLVYEFDNVLKSWDGTSNGKECSEGVYFYKAFALTLSGKEIEQHGFVHLIR